MFVYTIIGIELQYENSYSAGRQGYLYDAIIVTLYEGSYKQEIIQSLLIVKINQLF